MRPRIHHALAFVGLLVTAGCLGAITSNPAAPQTSTEAESTTVVSGNSSYYVFKNTESNTAYEVTVTVTRAPISAYNVTFVENGTEKTATFEEGIPTDIADKIAVEPAGGTLASRTYTVAPESSLFVRFEGMPANATFVATYRVEGERFLRGYSTVHESGCRSGLRAYAIVSAETLSGSSCGDFTDVLYENATTYHTLRPNENSTTTE